jgi:hypothetical protein
MARQNQKHKPKLKWKDSKGDKGYHTKIGPYELYVYYDKNGYMYGQKRWYFQINSSPDNLVFMDEESNCQIYNTKEDAAAGAELYLVSFLSGFRLGLLEKIGTEILNPINKVLNAS